MDISRKRCNNKEEKSSFSSTVIKHDGLPRSQTAKNQFRCIKQGNTPRTSSAWQRILALWGVLRELMGLAERTLGAEIIAIGANVIAIMMIFGYIWWNKVEFIC